MNEQSLKEIEAQLSIRLPEAYQRALLDEVFPGNSVAECMLIDDSDRLIAANRRCAELAQGKKRRSTKRAPPTLAEGCFAIGSDGSELRYYLNLESGAVVEYDLETGNLDNYAVTVGEYVDRIREIDREIDEDEDETEDLQPVSRWENFKDTSRTAFWVFLVMFIILPTIAFTVSSCFRWALGR